MHLVLLNRAGRSLAVRKSAAWTGCRMQDFWFIRLMHTKNLLEVIMYVVYCNTGGEKHENRFIGKLAGESGDGT